MGRRTFGEVTILPSGRYRARYRNPGNKTERIGAPQTFRTKRAAHEWLTEIEDSINKGTWKHPDEVRAEKERALREAAASLYTLNQWVEAWMGDLANRQASANTIRTYTSDIKPLTSKFGDRALRSITADDLKEWVSDLATYSVELKGGAVKRRTRSASTQQKVRTVAHACLEAAVVSERLDVNPMPRTRRATRMQKGVKKPLDYMPKESQVETAVGYATPVVAAAIMLAYYAGLRSGEVRFLRRKHIVASGGHPVVKVRGSMERSVTGGQVYGPGKSEEAIRDLPLGEKTAKWFRQYLKDHVGDDPDALVVYNPNTGGVMSEKSLWDGEKRWREARAHAGIRETFRFHDLRKACLTRLGQAGATLEQLKRFGGHSDVRSVMIYQVADQRQLRDLVERVGV